MVGHLEVIGRRQVLALLGGTAAAVGAGLATTRPAVARPLSRDPKVAIAHTREEGGRFWRGGADYGEFHSVFFEDGWVYDTRLAELGNNEGWRRSNLPAEEIKHIWYDPAENPGGYLMERAVEEYRHADWLYRRAAARERQV